MGMAITGNKVRKLEFVDAEALEQESDILVNRGVLQSNHARVTVTLSVTLCLKSQLVLAGEATDAPEGNLFLSLLLGAHITYLSITYLDGLNEYMEKFVLEYEKKGRKGSFHTYGMYFWPFSQGAEFSKEVFAIRERES